MKILCDLIKKCFRFEPFEVVHLRARRALSLSPWVPEPRDADPQKLQSNISLLPFISLNHKCEHTLARSHWARFTSQY